MHFFSKRGNVALQHCSSFSATVSAQGKNLGEEKRIVIALCARSP